MISPSKGLCSVWAIDCMISRRDLEHLVDAHQACASNYGAPPWTRLKFEALLQNGGDGGAPAVVTAPHDRREAVL